MKKRYSEEQITKFLREADTGVPVKEGVYKFKKGTGARLIEYPGEWEWSNSLMLSNISDFIVNRKVKNR